VDEMTPGGFDHPTAHAGVACLGEAPLASSLAALVWRSSQAGVARQSPTVPDLAGLDSGAKCNALKRSRFERLFQARQSRLGRAS
jgi:hypothetical protein